MHTLYAYQHSESGSPESGFFPEFRIRILPELFSGIPESGFFTGTPKSGFSPELQNPDFLQNSKIRIFSRIPGSVFFRKYRIRIFPGILEIILSGIIPHICLKKDSDIAAQQNKCLNEGAKVLNQMSLCLSNNLPLILIACQQEKNNQIKYFLNP